MGMIQLNTFDVVWAKYRENQWYPGIIVDPVTPHTVNLRNGAMLSTPPQDILDCDHKSQNFLILLFDEKKTWLWLARDELEPLGVDKQLDTAKLLQSKKKSEKEAIRKAYIDAINLHCITELSDHVADCDVGKKRSRKRQSVVSTDAIVEQKRQRTQRNVSELLKCKVCSKMYKTVHHHRKHETSCTVKEPGIITKKSHPKKSKSNRDLLLEICSWKSAWEKSEKAWAKSDNKWKKNIETRLKKLEKVAKSEANILYL